MRLGHRHASGPPHRGGAPGDGEDGPGRHRVVPRRITLLLQAENLRSGYGEMEILHGVSMTLDQGEMVVLIGPNGAGKSTLIKTIFGLLRPTEGRVRFRDTDITGYHPRDLVIMGLGYVPQTNNTFPTLSVLENLEMGAITRRISPLPLHWNRGSDQRRTQSRMMKDAEILERGRNRFAGTGEWLLHNADVGRLYLGGQA